MTKLVLECDVPPHRKKRGKHVKKKWKLEHRDIGPVQTGFMARLQAFNRDWHRFGSYSTERAMEDAFRGMTSQGGLWGAENFEFRKLPPTKDSA